MITMFYLAKAGFFNSPYLHPKLEKRFLGAFSIYLLSTLEKLFIFICMDKALCIEISRNCSNFMRFDKLPQIGNHLEQGVEEEEEVGRMVLVDVRLKALDVAQMTVVLRVLVEAEAEVDQVGRLVEAEVNMFAHLPPFILQEEKRVQLSYKLVLWWGDYFISTMQF